jgi:hypothetical protein
VVVFRDIMPCNVIDTNILENLLSLKVGHMALKIDCRIPGRNHKTGHLRTLQGFASSENISFTGLS